MYVKAIHYWYMLLMFSCSCQKTVSDKPTNLDNNTSEYIEAFLGEKNFSIVTNTNTIINYEVRKSLIKGTTNEYSNRLVFKDTLNALKTEKLRFYLKKDNSYNWDIKEVVDFEPHRQYLLIYGDNRITLLINEAKTIIGFINLEGQRLISITPDFSKVLRELE